MGVHLVKGQRIDVGLEKVRIGLGWDPAVAGAAFDLDASAFLVDARGRVPSREYFVHYDHRTSADGAVGSSGDDETGAAGTGDDETLFVDFAKLHPRIEQIVVCVTIHDAERLGQTFGQVENAFVRIEDAVSGTELCRFELHERFSQETALEFARLYRRGSTWRFEALGTAVPGGLDALIARYA